jgi:pimeloyl-ACP methyl ester carboxylesterase
MNPIILLHGALGASDQLNPLKQLLEASGRTVYTFNFSGHGGRAFPSSFTIETFANDLDAFLLEHHLHQVDVFGYSMGGYVALWYALNHPEKINFIATLGTKFDWNPESVATELKKLNPSKIEEKVPSFAAALAKRHAPNDWKDLMHKTGDMMTALGSNPLLTVDNVLAIQNKIVVGQGDQDDMADRGYAEKIAATLPNGRFVLFSDTPHPIEKVDITKIADLFT